MTSADRSNRKSVNLFTPRDLLNLTDNPASLPVAEIRRIFGVSKYRASKVRELACRSPEVLARQYERIASPWWRPLGWGA